MIEKNSRYIMQRIAKFEKVSEKQFLSDMQKQGLEADYAKIRLPLRATAGSAGYDFCTPVDFKLEPGQEITIPTGIRAQMQDGWVLVCCPRSGRGKSCGWTVPGACPPS